MLQKGMADSAMHNLQDPLPAITRRDFLQRCGVSAAVLASGAVLGRGGAPGIIQNGPAARVLPLKAEWLFGGKFTPGTTQPAFPDGTFDPVTLPHCAAPLSWRRWNPASWEEVWIYRRHFAWPQALRQSRVFLEFDGVTVGATPVINGHALPEHLGAYLPFRYELTGLLKAEDNVLAVAVDGRWRNAPPEGSPRGAAAVDYYIPAGITRPARLRAVPSVFISDVFAKPVAVLAPERRVEVTGTLDAAVVPSGQAVVRVELRRGRKRIAHAEERAALRKPGETQVKLTLSGLGNVALWEPANPHLYEVLTTLLIDGRPIHNHRIRIGFREARFEADGFFLNGSRFRLFGLDRHELFPYTGSAMPARTLRHDAEILRRQFNCNVARCSHYPQSEAFIEACDELGLMLWEELPGWQYLGDAAWKGLAVRDVRDMVRRDRNHPSVIIWGVRINESANDPALYAQTKRVAKALDGSRPTSGAMNRYSTHDWLQDVYAFDDYHAAPDGSVAVRKPLPGVPYFLSEGVGQFQYGRRKGFGQKYRRAGSIAVQEQQALLHAQIHSKAAQYPRMGGVIAWCAFDYGSPMNSCEGVKCPGVADIFRIPKLGASFYMAQVEPLVRPVIEPNFFWNFGPKTPSGPGRNASIFSNCQRLELFISGDHHATAWPDKAGFPNLKFPPFFVDLTVHGTFRPELRIDGYVGQKLLLSRSFSADPVQDQFLIRADDTMLIADGSDATRVVFGVVDKFGAPRAFAGGTVDFRVEGPGILVGDNPFDLAPSGGAAAVWVKTRENASGQIKVTALHSTLGAKSIAIRAEAFEIAR
jgi:beta-galactosidase